MLTTAYQLGIKIDDLPVERMIESNHGGTTWKGFWQSTEVIIKVINLKESTKKNVVKFNKECTSMRIFNSANILPLLGSCISFPDLIIVTRFMPYGSLFSLLHKQALVVIDLSHAINLANDVAKGMAFLHNMEPMFQTYDLNSRHVMIDEDLTAKINIADSGFSFSDRKRLYHPAWMAPESKKYR